VVKQGTLTREHVEALQVVYPEIYKQMQLRIMDRIQQGAQLFGLLTLTFHVV